MDYLEIPLRTLRTKQDALLTYVEDFTDATFLLMTGHLQGQDLSAQILKDMAQRPNINAPPSLVTLQNILKEFLFEYRRNMTTGTTMNHNANLKRDEKRSKVVVGADLLKNIIDNRDTPSTKWPVVLLTDQSATKIKLERANIMKNVDKHMKLVTEAAAIGKKTMSHYHRAQAQYDKYVDVNIKHSVAWQKDGHIDLEKMRNDRLGKKYFMSEGQFERIKGKYDRIRDKHEEVITALKKMAQEIQRVIERETELSLQHGVRQLKEIGQSIILSKTLTKDLDKIDVQLIAKDVYSQLCVSYEFPDISRYVITSGKGYVKNQTFNIDPKDEKTGHVDKAFLVTDFLDTNINDVYVKAKHNIAEETVGDLKLKKDQVAKLKLCSCDNRIGFGWTKNIFGQKKWGFFDRVATRTC